MSQADTVVAVPCLKDKSMVRESVSMMKNGKATGPSLLVSEIVKTAGEVGSGMVTAMTQ